MFSHTRKAALPIEDTKTNLPSKCNIQLSVQVQGHLLSYSWEYSDVSLTSGFVRPTSKRFVRCKSWESLMCTGTRICPTTLVITKQKAARKKDATAIFNSRLLHFFVVVTVWQMHGFKNRYSFFLGCGSFNGGITYSFSADFCILHRFVVFFPYSKVIWEQGLRKDSRVILFGSYCRDLGVLLRTWKYQLVL